jgi:hypothetical protein
MIWDGSSASFPVPSLPTLVSITLASIPHQCLKLIAQMTLVYLEHRFTDSFGKPLRQDQWVDD